MEYTIILHPAEEGGYWVKVPAFPGSYSQGETIEEAMANAKEAIEAHLQALKEEGRSIPKEEGLCLQEWLSLPHSFQKSLPIFEDKLPLLGRRRSG
jgi:predicted RNase H-like HicB family nuclease